MKKVFLLVASLICFLSNGCSKLVTEIADEPPLSTSGSSIFVRSTSAETATNNTFDSNNVGQPVFSGNDILWFNEITRELRFKDNFALRQTILKNDAISFFIKDEYLFSSLVYVSSKGEQLINSMVLYYNQVENKYFLLDGYPEHYIEHYMLDKVEYTGSKDIDITDRDDIRDLPQYIKDLRAENALKIESEWERFINQLKKEGLLK